jgi:N-acyl-D-aspartate/D-glutamate deacylase
MTLRNYAGSIQLCSAEMAFDLIVRNARLADGNAARATVDIAIAGGHIAAVGPRLSGEGESVDAG